MQQVSFRRAMRWFVRCSAVIGMATCLLAVSPSCRHLEVESGPRARVAKDGELALSINRLGEDPDYVYTSAGVVEIKIAVDPAIARPQDVKSYDLWLLDGKWKRIARAGRKQLPIRFQAHVEGRYGLRASIQLKDGRRVLEPDGEHGVPQAWLCYDTTAPVITFQRVRRQHLVGGRQSLEIAWKTHEEQFGSDPFEVEWSDDEGETWQAVGILPAAAGEARMPWHYPPALEGPIRLRVQSRDLAGNEAAQEIRVRLEELDSSAPFVADASKKEVSRDEESRDEARRAGSARTVASAAREDNAVSKRATSRETAGDVGSDVDGSTARGDTESSRREDGGSETAAGERGDSIDDLLGRGRDGSVDGGDSADAEEPPRDDEGGEVLPDVEDLVGAPLRIGGEQGVAATSSKTPSSDPSDPASATGDGSEVHRVDAARIAVLEPIEALRDGCLRGGTRATIAWRMAPGLESGSRTVRLESAYGRGGTWRREAEAALSDRQLVWQVPLRSTAACRLRLRVRGRGTETLDKERQPLASEPFAIDADAPAVWCRVIPPSTGHRLELAAEWTDEPETDCSGLEAVTAWVRLGGGPRNSRAWKALPEAAVSSRIDAAKGQVALALDLSSLASGKYDLALTGRDRVGNEGEAPSTAIGSFQLDSASPDLIAQPLTEPWVGGFLGSLRFDYDPAGAVPPLVIEGRGQEDEPWFTLQELATLQDHGGKVDFLVPAGHTVLEVRVRVSDAAGNEASIRFGPRPVEPSIRWSEFPRQDSFVGLSSEFVRWDLHPVAREVAQDLRVRLSEQIADVGRGSASEADWKAPPAASCFGSEGHVVVPANEPYILHLPNSDLKLHRLVAELLLGTEVVGSATSAPFRVTDTEDSIGVVAISQESLDISDFAIGKLQASRDLDVEHPQYRQQRAQLLTDAENGLRQALAIDPANYRASSELARLLSELGPSVHRSEITELFEQAARKHPDPALPLTDLGRFYLMVEDWPAAAGALERSLTARETPTAHLNLGQVKIYRPTRDYDEAAEHFEKALLSTDRALLGDAAFYLAHCLQQLDRKDEALTVYKKYRADMEDELRIAIAKELGIARQQASSN